MFLFMLNRSIKMSNVTQIICPADTPFGTFTAVYEGGLIIRVLFPGERPGYDIDTKDTSLPFAAQMYEYIEGRRKNFSLPVLMRCTNFMRDVYNAVINIPYGTTAAYSDVAYAAGHPRACRAAGNALSANPLPLIIPCHRVVHKTGEFSRYRGGTSLKRYLLEIEGAVQ